MWKLFLFPALAICAQTPTIDQSLSAKQVMSAEISPDGRYVAYVVQQANWEENSFDTQIWISLPGDGRALPAHQRQEIEPEPASGRPIRSASRSLPTATASARSI